MIWFFGGLSLINNWQLDYLQEAIMDIISKTVIFMIRNTGSGFPGGFGTIHTLGLVPVLKLLSQNIAHVQ